MTAATHADLPFHHTPWQYTAGMSPNTILKRLLDAGMQFTEMSRTNADKLVNELVHDGHVRRKDAETTVQQLVERGRSSTDHILSAVQAEVAKQLGRFANRIDDVEDRIEDLADSLGVAAKRRTASAPAPTPAAEQPVSATTSGDAVVSGEAAPAPAGKAAKKAPAKKSAKKAPAKKAPAAGSSGVAKVATKKAAKR